MGGNTVRTAQKTVGRFSIGVNDAGEWAVTEYLSVTDTEPFKVWWKTYATKGEAVAAAKYRLSMDPDAPGKCDKWCQICGGA